MQPPYFSSSQSKSHCSNSNIEQIGHNGHSENDHHNPRIDRQCNGFQHPGPPKTAFADLSIDSNQSSEQSICGHKVSVWVSIDRCLPALPGPQSWATTMHNSPRSPLRTHHPSIFTSNGQKGSKITAINPRQTLSNAACRSQTPRPVLPHAGAPD